MEYEAMSNADTAKEILDAAMEAVRKIEAAQKELVEASHRVGKIGEVIGTSSMDPRLRTLSKSASLGDLPSSNIERIRRISNELKDPDLAYRILDELPDGILLVDRKGLIQLVNKQTEALFGYTRFELDGSPLSLLLPDAMKDEHAAHLKAWFAMPSKRPMMDSIKHNLKLVGMRKDGTEIKLDISLTPLSTPGDKFVLAVTREKV
jgi:PAS domain S-box-containing protein